MKKLLSLVLVLTLVLSSFAFATPTDVVGTNSESAVNKLMGLNILNGYPDGSFQPAATISRAEFAAVAVRLLGLEQAATYAKGATKFSDVPSMHWASGYVNIATDQGIIKGYPNGKFAPNGNVTYAEAITILVRVLGYAPEVDEKGTWPSNYIAKATILGVTDGVLFGGSQPATRGAIAMFADNSLTIPMMIRTGFGTEAKYEVPTGLNELTLLGSKIKATSFEGYIVNTKALEADYKHDVKLDQLKATDNKTEELDFAAKASFDFTSHLGEKVKAWKNADGDIFFVETKGTVVKSKLASDITAVATSLDVLKAGDNTDVATYYFDDKSTHVATSAAAMIYINVPNSSDFTNSILKKATNAEVNALVASGNVAAKLVLDGKVIKTATFIKMVTATVDAVGTDKIELPGKDLALAGMSSNFDLKTIAKDDVINYYMYNTNVENAAGDDIVRFEILKMATAVEGKLTKVTTNKIMIGTTEYLYKDAAGITVASPFNTRVLLEAVLGDTIKVTFDRYGNVATVKNVTATASGDYGLVTDMGAIKNAYGKYSVVVKMLNAKNEVVEYSLTSDATITDNANSFKLDTVLLASDANSGMSLVLSGAAASITINENYKTGLGNTAYTVVTYKLNSDGKISSLTLLDNSATSNVLGAPATLAPKGPLTYKKDAGILGTFKIDSSTPIYNSLTEKVVTLAELKDNGQYVVSIVEDTKSNLNEVKFVLVTGGTGSIATDTKVAFFQKYDTLTNGFTVYLWNAGVRTAYFISEDDTNITALDALKATSTLGAVEVKFSGANVTAITAPAGLTSLAQYTTPHTLVAIDAGARIINLSSTVLVLAADVQVYNRDNVDGAITASDITNLDESDTTYTYRYTLNADGHVNLIIVNRP